MGTPRGDIERWGTVYVFEDPPPPTRPRWYVHWEGDEGPGVDDVDDAVGWGLARARIPWPPSVSERHQIDMRYEAAIARELGEEESRAA